MKRTYRVVCIFLILTFTISFVNVYTVKADTGTGVIQTIDDKSKLLLIAAMTIAMGVKYTVQDNINYYNAKIYNNLKSNADNFKKVSSKALGDCYQLTGTGYANMKNYIDTIKADTKLDTAFINANSNLFPATNSLTNVKDLSGWLLYGDYKFGVRTASGSMTYHDFTKSGSGDYVSSWNWTICPQDSNYMILNVQLANGTNLNGWFPWIPKDNTSTLSIVPLASGGSVCVTPPGTALNNYNPTIDKTADIAIPVGNVQGGSISADTFVGKTYADIATSVSTPSDLVDTGAGTGTATKDYTNQLDSIQRSIDNVANPSVPSSVSLDFTPLMVATNKFPFCIPWDLINVVKSFNADRQAPKWHVEFPSMYGMQKGSIDIDLSNFDKVAIILRYFLLVAFVWFLAEKTRDLVRG